MSEEVKVTPEVTPTVTPTTTADVVTPPETAGKLFTQQEVDKIINSRFAREKAAFEKNLTEQKEALERQAFDKTTELEKQLAEKDKQLLGYAKGIASDKLDEALALANTKMAKVSGLTLDEALTQVGQEFPTLTGATKAGAPIQNQPNPTNPYWTDEMKRLHPDLWEKVKNKN